MRSLNGASVVVAGASSGLGRATALAFARRGCRLVLAARREPVLREVARHCLDAGAPAAIAITTDVSEPDDVQALAEAAVARFGAIDIWINMAGVSLWGRFEDIPAEAQARLLSVNLTGVVLGSHAAVRAMLAGGGGGLIINMASLAGRVPVPFCAAYTASKFGVAGFSEALRDELGVRSAIRVCAVYPSFVNTPTDLHSANYTGRVLRALPPVLDPDYVAERVVGLWGRPRRSLPLGLHFALQPAYALAPGLTGWLTAQVMRRFLFGIGAPAPRHDGSLFAPLAEGTGSHGSWAQPRSGDSSQPRSEESRHPRSGDPIPTQSGHPVHPRSGGPTRLLRGPATRPRSGPQVGRRPRPGVTLVTAAVAGLFAIVLTGRARR